MTNAERILAAIARRPGLDDDELARITGISPRQQVNQICRRLEGRGLLERRTGPSGKIGNFPSGKAPAAPRSTAASAAIDTPPLPARPCVTTSPAIDPAALRHTLLLIPCSGAKRVGGVPGTTGPEFADALPPALARRLLEARRTVLAAAGADERLRLPAWQRYAGMFYTCAGSALGSAVNAGLHVLILSGGYGVLEAAEPIGTYSTRLHLARWPRGLLQDVLLAYATAHHLTAMRAFVSGTTDYCRLVQRTRWRDAGIRDAVILAPEPTRGAMVKAPRAQGEAFAACLAGRLHDGWRSSDGLALRATPLV